MADVKVPTRPAPPEPPPSRVQYYGLGGPLMFDSPAELAAWKAESWWRRLLGLTAHDRKMRSQRA